MKREKTTAPLRQPEDSFRLYPMGDTAVVVSFGEAIDPQIASKVQAFARQLVCSPFAGFVELVPAFTTVTVYYSPLEISSSPSFSPFDIVSQHLRQLLKEVGEVPVSTPPKVIQLPVYYGGDFGPDLPEVAQTNGLTPEEVIQLHTAGEYHVYMIGFVPGFPYLGGMDPKIATPRKASPRAAVPAGSVGIAGTQTGVYPLETPGGWQIIGRTPMPLFRPQHQPPALLQAGQMVRFYDISESDYKAWGKEQHEF